MENIYETLSAFYMPDLSTKQMELNAIWLEKKLLTANECTRRITAGMLVKVEDGKLVNCNDEPTHRVSKCLGTVYDTLMEFVLTDLITGADSSVKL